MNDPRDETSDDRCLGDDPALEDTNKLPIETQHLDDPSATLTGKNLAGQRPVVPEAVSTTSKNTLTSGVTIGTRRSPPASCRTRPDQYTVLVGLESCEAEAGATVPEMRGPRFAPASPRRLDCSRSDFASSNAPKPRQTSVLAPRNFCRDPRTFAGIVHKRRQHCG
jgi:hypothetical protein